MDGTFAIDLTIAVEILKPGESDLLLPDDGIIDLVAVDIAARGQRIVRLTARERRLAADRILAAGGDLRTVAERLGVCRQTVWRLMNEPGATP